MPGKLTLVPTPIDDESKLDINAFELLVKLDASEDIVVVEEIKNCRRRWLRWGLAREWVDRFRTYNEHDHQEARDSLLRELKQGKNVWLLSDCGLPAFCDPGRLLVQACHQQGIKVTATPFANSVILALALSGFDHSQFHFYGFIPQKSEQREEFYLKVLKQNQTSILMDTPYRLNKLLPELSQIESKLGVERQYFFGLNLNAQDEQLYVGKLNKLKNIDALKGKAEFILIIGP
jgi:16S rRNA (cytidine1402-2'-O)-methyltransferase